MNRLRCLLFAAIVAISNSTLAFGGDMQFPGHNGPPPPPPVPATSTESTKDGVTAPTQADEIQIELQDLATALLSQILLTIY